MFQGTTLANSYGIAPEELLAIVNEISGQSYSAEHARGFASAWRVRMGRPDDDPPLLKDLRDALNAVSDASLALPWVEDALGMAAELAHAWTSTVGDQLGVTGD